MNKFQKTAKGQILTYPQYISWVEELVSQGKTSGNNQIESLAGYTALNLKRMQRISRTLKLSDTFDSVLNDIEGQQDWWVITEAWCGDSAQNLPIISRVSEESKGKINLHIIVRDDNPELMEQYLTDGSKSIPKLVAFNQEGEELFTWGPRPVPSQQILLDWKANPNGRSWDDFEKELHTWYARDKSKLVQQEILALIYNKVPTLSY